MNKDRFLNNAVIELFHDILDVDKKEKGEIKLLRPSGTLRLVGGAVVDILEGRKPKDYDFVGFDTKDIERFKAHGFKHSHTTKTASTYYNGEIVVQFIIFTPDQFGFTISQSSYDFRNKNLEVDLDSFESKKLIPVSFEIRQNVTSALRRIPHWKKKGYDIHELTYLSLINQALRDNSVISS